MIAIHFLPIRRLTIQLEHVKLDLGHVEPIEYADDLVHFNVVLVVRRKLTYKK